MNKIREEYEECDCNEGYGPAVDCKICGGTGEVDKIREELKPCPCCKSNRIIHYWTENNLYVIECDVCGLMVAKQYISAAEKAWNTRSADPEIEPLKQDCKNLTDINNNQAEIMKSRDEEITELKVAISDNLNHGYCPDQLRRALKEKNGD